MSGHGPGVVPAVLLGVPLLVGGILPLGGSGGTGPLDGTAHASVSEDEVQPGAAFTATYTVASPGLLEATVAEQVRCELTDPQGRTVGSCLERGEALDVRLLGTEQTHRFTLRAPGDPGVYTIHFTSGGLSLPASASSASTAFAVEEPGPRADGQPSTGGDADPHRTSTPARAGPAPGDGGARADGGSWLLDHPWVLVALAAAASVAAFSWAARASPPR